MKHQALSDLYAKRREEFSSVLSKTITQINLISNLRLAAALAFLILFYFSFTNKVFGYGAALFVVLFFILVKKHALLFFKKTHLENLVKVNLTEEKALQKDYTLLHPGNQFIDPLHAYSHDLDIFGRGSLFQFINRCNTINGQKLLASNLNESLKDALSITERQEAIKDLAPRIDFRQHFQAAGTEIDEQPGDAAQLLDWLKQPSMLKSPKVIRIILIVLPLLTLCALIAAIFKSELRVFVTGFVLIQWIITGAYLKRINVFHDYIGRKKNILKKYAHLLYHLEHEKFTSVKMKQLWLYAQDADAKIKTLASLVNALDARTNALATIFVNSLLLWDMQCVYRLEKWRAENASNLLLWLNTISECELLCSYGTYAFNNPSFSFATISSELSIRADDLAHPLISEDERISNTLHTGPAPSVFIVTGANMAGKSTFLRTLGVNLILALNGAPVCATSFTCPVINLRTGMRTADSLQDHQSYFYAELNRLKTIMDELRSNTPLVILLDEILKGTNSTDKQAGSMALVKQLLPYPCIAVIATHDLALGALQHEYPEQVKNYCFEAVIENDQLYFDYKLKTGLATKMNASFLMKKMGIIPKD